MFIPIMINTSKYQLIIFGGGPVAYRRAKGLIEQGMKTTVISPDIIDEFQNILQDMDYIKDVFQEKYIKENSLILAATSSPAINMHILACCQKRGIPCNVAHSKEDCDFIFPATFQKGDIIGSISTQGQSPGLAKQLKENIEDSITDEFIEKVEEMGKIRNLVLEKCMDIKRRRGILKGLLDLSLEELKDRRQEYENCRRI